MLSRSGRSSWAIPASLGGVVVDGVPWSQNAAGRVVGDRARFWVEQGHGLDGAVPCVTDVEHLDIERRDGGVVVEAKGVGGTKNQLQARFRQG